MTKVFANNTSQISFVSPIRKNYVNARRGFGLSHVTSRTIKKFPMANDRLVAEASAKKSVQMASTQRSKINQSFSNCNKIRVNS